jgi:molybdopterin converting factor small subunit
MSIDIEFSSVFSKYTDNQTDVKAEGKTVGECLHDLARQYPEFGNLILDKNGNLTPTFDVFVNGDIAYPNTMAYPVKAGDKLNIIMLIHGG